MRRWKGTGAGSKSAIIHPMYEMYIYIVMTKPYDQIVVAFTSKEMAQEYIGRMLHPERYYIEIVRLV